MPAVVKVITSVRLSPVQLVTTVVPSGLYSVTGGAPEYDESLVWNIRRWPAVTVKDAVAFWPGAVKMRVAVPSSGWTKFWLAGTTHAWAVIEPDAVATRVDEQRVGARGADGQGLLQRLAGPGLQDRGAVGSDQLHCRVAAAVRVVAGLDHDALSGVRENVPLEF